MTIDTNNKRPNFLFIMADQFRHDYLGYRNDKITATPTIDALAKEGMIFTQCVTNSPLCSPARICLATGQHAEHVGALDNVAYCPRTTTTYYQRLRDADYRVGCVGKLDLAKGMGDNADGQRPATFQWGFTHPLECEGKRHAGRGPAEGHGPYTNWLKEKGLLDIFREDYEARSQTLKEWASQCESSKLPTEAFEDVYIGQKSAEWIRKQPKSNPWHLFVSFVGPHDPYDPPEEYSKLYENAEVDEPIPDTNTDRHPWVHKKQAGWLEDLDNVRKTRRQYLASIKAIDDQVKELLTALDERGERENTYIIFTADHGEMLGDLDMYFKSVPNELSVRIPLLITGPGIEAGSESDALVELADLNASICDLAGLPQQENIDAKSFKDVCLGKAEEHREESLIILAPYRCVRTKTHKLVAYRDGFREFYDIENDPYEQNNLIKNMPENKQSILRHLNQRLVYRTSHEAAWNC